MGQQQLLLLVLGIVIVGLAVVVGIQAFGENQKKANSDALVNDGVRIASDIQAWALKPGAFGGGANDFHQGTGTTPVALTMLGYDTADVTDCAAGQYENLHGCFTIAVADANTVTITGNSIPDSDNYKMVFLSFFVRLYLG